ncbi:MAG: hypothetical protein RR531_11745, partial [Longicatena sp.]
AFANTQTEDSSSTHQLSTIVVSAAGFEQDIKNAPASISVITQEDIRNYFQQFSDIEMISQSEVQSSMRYEIHY